MTANQRIFLNIIATYGRSLYVLVIGLFCGRWSLMALGQVDLGLLGVVGGLMAFIGFFFGILSGAVGRFYAFAIGKAQTSNDPKQGLEECREWFSLAVTIHTVIPVILLIVGYPFGEWAVRNYLTIPVGRIDACLWVWRFTCISSFLGMVTVPFNAMYGAKQYIAELTLYSVASTTCNLFFLHHMITHPGDWLARYALWSCLLSILPQIIITIRAYFIFPECRFRRKYAWNWSKYKEMLSYTGWNMFGSLGYLLKGQGVTILVNKYFGPAVNASLGIANNVSAQTQSLSSSLQGAFTPAITTALGAGDFDGARRFAYRFCKFGMILALLFMIPLSLELPYVMKLWLKNPPEFVAGLCWLMLLMAFIDKNTLGLGVAVMANGKIRGYQVMHALFNLLTLPSAWLFCAMGYNVYYTHVGILISWSLLVYCRLYFARRLIGVSIRYWAQKIMLPVYGALVLAVMSGLSSRLFMEASFTRLIVSSALCEAVFIPVVWFLVFDREEKAFTREKILMSVGRLRKKIGLDKS